MTDEDVHAQARARYENAAAALQANLAQVTAAWTGGEPLNETTAEQVFRGAGYVFPHDPGAELGICFDRDGRPIGPTGLRVLRENDDYRNVAEHWIRDWRISTVWIGFDQSPVPPSFRKGGWRPEIFETMIFGPGGHVRDGELPDVPDGLTVEQARALALEAIAGARVSYATTAEAADGHERAVWGLRRLLGAQPWEVLTWEQYTGQQWAVAVDGYQLVIRGGAIAGYVQLPAGDPPEPGRGYDPRPRSWLPLLGNI